MEPVLAPLILILGFLIGCCFCWCLSWRLCGLCTLSLSQFVLSARYSLTQRIFGRRWILSILSILCTLLCMPGNHTSALQKSVYVRRQSFERSLLATQKLVVCPCQLPNKINVTATAHFVRLRWCISNNYLLYKLTNGTFYSF